LKKSEQERNPEKVPDLATHHNQVQPTEKPTNRLVIFGSLLLLLNIAALIYFISGNDKKVIENPIAVIHKDTPEVNLEPQPVKKPVQKAAPKPIQVNTPNYTKSNPQPAPRKADLDLSDISDLPLDVQNRIPSLEFSSHIYIASGGSFIIINGRSYNEGMRITDGLRILRITSKGVILEFENYTFLLRSMVSWN